MICQKNEEKESTCHHVLLKLAKEANVASKQSNIWKIKVIYWENCTHEEPKVSKDKKEETLEVLVSAPQFLEGWLRQTESDPL